MSDLDIFRNEFVPASQKHKRVSMESWSKSAPADYTRWVTYRDALLAGQSPQSPTMVTEYGKMLVAAGKMLTQIAPPPPPPNPLSSTITSGGSYSGFASAVRIDTTQPVLIHDSVIDGGPGYLVSAVAGAQVTIERTRFKGTGRAFIAAGIKSLIVRNCDVERTTGFRLDSASGVNVLFEKNRIRNIQKEVGTLEHMCAFQCANVSGVVELAWNEIINDPPVLVGGVWQAQCGVEDNISFFASQGGRVHDNYIQGSYPWKFGSAPSDPHSGSGIMTGDFAGGNHEVWNNIVVSTTNCGIGIAAGTNIRVRDNRVVCWGRLPDGTPLTATNLGIWANGGAGCFVEHNVVGWLRPNGVRADIWPVNATVGQNTSLPDPIDYSDEQAEYTGWLAKVAAAGVVIGIP